MIKYSCFKVFFLRFTQTNDINIMITLSNVLALFRFIEMVYIHALSYTFLYKFFFISALMLWWLNETCLLGLFFHVGHQRTPFTPNHFQCRRSPQPKLNYTETQGRGELVYSAGSIPWLLKTWHCKEPGYQQSWYWPTSAGISSLSIRKINTLRLRQNRCHFQWIFLNENVRISFKISLNFVPRSAINNIPALVQIMAWCWPPDKPLFEPMMFSLLMHIYVTRSQWVKCWYYIHGQTIQSVFTITLNSTG